MEPSEVTRIELPAALVKDSLGCSFDLGGTRCKYVYVEKSPNRQQKEGTVTLCFGCFKIADFQHAVEYVKSKGYCFDATNPPLLHTTGISCRHANKAVIEDTLNVRVDNLAEVETFLHGFLKLAHTLPKSFVVMPTDAGTKKAADETENAVFKLQREFDSICLSAPSGGAVEKSASDSLPEYGGWDSELPYSQADPDLFPCIIGSYGTGHVSCQMQEDGKMRLIDIHFGRSGVAFVCLGHVLCGTADYDELLALAEKGDDSSVHLLFGDAKEPGQEDQYTLLPDWQTAFYFHKYLEARMKGEEVKKEDLARGLVNFMASETAHQVFWYARAYSCRRVFLLGGLLKHPLMRTYITRAFMTANKFRPADTPSTEVYFPCRGEYMCVLGTLFDGADYYKKLEGGK